MDFVSQLRNGVTVTLGARPSPVYGLAQNAQLVDCPDYGSEHGGPVVESFEADGGRGGDGPVARYALPSDIFTPKACRFFTLLLSLPRVKILREHLKVCIIDNSIEYNNRVKCTN